MSGRRARQGAVDKLIEERVDPQKAPLKLGIIYAANHRKAGTCTYTGCKFAMHSGFLCKQDQPIKAKKSDLCGICGRVFRVEEKVRVDSAICATKSQRQQRRAKRQRGNRTRLEDHAPHQALNAHAIMVVTFAKMLH